ncbi:MAG: helix-hairpin-helix domain-containing protein [Planctomycetales bacterium]
MPSGSTDEKSWLFRRADQAVIAVVNLAALAVIAAYWIHQGGLSGRLVDVDRAPPVQQAAEFKVDVNRADWVEFAQLPGLGEILAKRIIELRETQGPFADHDDLRRVKGIGEKKLEAIRPYLRPI